MNPKKLLKVGVPAGRRCKVCGGLVPSPNRKYCSTKCRIKHFSEKRSFLREQVRMIPLPAKKCIVCGKEFVPPCSHPRRKYCSYNCIKKSYKLRHRKKYLSQELERYHRKKYAGNYLRVLERDKKCLLCGSEKNLEVHHKDNRGAKCKVSPNHSLDNLVVLCRNCHRKITAVEWYYENKKIFIKSQSFELLGLPKEIIVEVSSSRR